MSNLLDLLGLVKLLKSPRAGPNPTALKSLVAHEDVGRRRNLSCPEYDRCLDVAYRSVWRSWSCEHCAYFSLAGDYRSADVAHGAVTRVGSALQ